MAFRMCSCAFPRDEEIEGAEINRGLWGVESGVVLNKSEQRIPVHPDDEQQDEVVVTVETRLRSTPK